MQTDGRAKLHTREPEHGGISHIINSSQSVMDKGFARGRVDHGKRRAQTYNRTNGGAPAESRGRAGGGQGAKLFCPFSYNFRTKEGPKVKNFTDSVPVSQADCYLQP